MIPGRPKTLVCPFESRHERAPALMRPRIIAGKIGGPGERETVEGAQIRWTCPSCGYGEVEADEPAAPPPAPPPKFEPPAEGKFEPPKEGFLPSDPWEP